MKEILQTVLHSKTKLRDYIGIFVQDGQEEFLVLYILDYWLKYVLVFLRCYNLRSWKMTANYGYSDEDIVYIHKWFDETQPFGSPHLVFLFRAENKTSSVPSCIQDACFDRLSVMRICNLYVRPQFRMEVEKIK